MTLLEDELVNDNNEFFYITLSFLLSKNESSIIPETVYFLNPDQLLKFISIYGGSKVYVPTMKEFSLDLLSAVAAYYKISKQYPWNVIQEKLKVDKRLLNSIKSRVQDWNTYMNEKGLDVNKILGVKNG